jgi:hypothetical protein
LPDDLSAHDCINARRLSAASFYRTTKISFRVDLPSIRELIDCLDGKAAQVIDQGQMTVMQLRQPT